MPSNIEQTIHKLREGKSELRQVRRAATLEEKLRSLIRAQQMYVALVGSRRPLASWQKPWGHEPGPDSDISN